jgi:predicted GTPase
MSQIKLPAKPKSVDVATITKIDSAFKPSLEKMKELVPEIKEALNLDETNKENTEKFKQVRLKLVKVRTATDKIHKNEKAQYIDIPKYIDGTRKTIKDGLLNAEAQLKEKEEYFERLEAERKAKLRQERIDQLMPLMSSADAVPDGLDTMDANLWDVVLQGFKSAYEKRKDDEARKEEELRKIREENAKRQEELQRQRELEKGDLDKEAKVNADRIGRDQFIQYLINAQQVRFSDKNSDYFKQVSNHLETVIDRIKKHEL